jgi:hypothetical protein
VGCPLTEIWFQEVYEGCRHGRKDHAQSETVS